MCLRITLILGALLLRARRQLREAIVACTVFDRAATIAQKSRQEAANLREMLDAVPMPVWRRGLDFALVDCNRAYADALDTTAELALAEGRELVSGAQPGERRHVVIGGSRRLFEIGEMTCGTGGAIGFAVDRTDLETAEAELWRHINAHAEVLEGVGTSIAIYGPDKRLRFSNTAFASMWSLAEDWLAAEPSFGEILERLRERRRLPEGADFRRSSLSGCGCSPLIEPQHELMHLPDGRTLLLSISRIHSAAHLRSRGRNDRLALERSAIR